MSKAPAVESFSPLGLETFSPTYSHISRTALSPISTLISFAGQIGADTSNGNRNIPSSLAEQCDLAFANVDKCLAAAGARKDDIVQVRQYVVDLLRGGAGQDPERAKRYVAWIGELRPPSTLLGVQALAAPGLLYEIEVVCVVHHEIRHQA